MRQDPRRRSATRCRRPGSRRRDRLHDRVLDQAAARTHRRGRDCGATGMINGNIVSTATASTGRKSASRLSGSSCSACRPGHRDRTSAGPRRSSTTLAPRRRPAAQQRASCGFTSTAVAASADGPDATSRIRTRFSTSAVARSGTSILSSLGAEKHDASPRFRRTAGLSTTAHLACCCWPNLRSLARRFSPTRDRRALPFRRRFLGTRDNPGGNAGALRTRHRRQRRRTPLWSIDTPVASRLCTRCDDRRTRSRAALAARRFVAHPATPRAFSSASRVD